MALCVVKEVFELGNELVLAAERYDPRRESLRSDGTSLREVASTIRETVAPSREKLPCLVLDTSHAREGFVVTRSGLSDLSEIGSMKKVVHPGDVIVSRLRPYLRQVALVDEELLPGPDVLLVCSTEFHVLRSRDEESIAFLVALLLCGPVQRVLAAAQEGGHHPRFDEQTLLGLPVPREWLEKRGRISESVEESARLLRASERGLQKWTRECEELLNGVGVLGKKRA